MPIKVAYIGQGEYHMGIPARDLTDEDWEALSSDERALVRSSPAYRMVEAKAAPKAEAPAATTGPKK